MCSNAPFAMRSEIYFPNIRIHLFAKHFLEGFGRPTKDLQSIVRLFVYTSGCFGTLHRNFKLILIC